MTLRRYKLYKDSGVEWLGAVPAHWDVAAVGYRYEVLLGKMLDEKRITGNHLAPYLRNIDVQWDRINVEDLPQMDFSGDDLDRYRVAPGDLLVCEGGEVGRAAIWRGELPECYYQKAIHRLRRRSETADHPRFMFYVLRMATAIGVFEASEGKSTIAHLTAEALRRYRFGFPPRREQECIAAFLDREVVQIDTLIAEQQRLIELLTEKRQAVIAQAVTTGLNPSMPMKDSGVEWLGAVPAHWDVVRLKFIAHVQTGIAKGKDNSGKLTTEVPYLRVANVQDGYLDLDDVSTIELPADDLPRYRLQAGDVLMNEGGDFDKLGRGHVWDGSIDPCIHQNHVFAVRPFAVSPRWLNAVTGSAYAQFYFMSRSKQSTNLASISSTNIMELPVVIPPADEQEALLDWLDAQSTAFDRLIEDAGNAVRLLRERRTALVSAAVTGQIDVRDRSSLDTALAETCAEIAAGRCVVESAAAHVARLQAMTSADKQSAPPPAPC